MTADKPSPPPEAALLRLVRTAAGIKASDAAASVARHSLRRFSASRWSQVENGYETRDGGYKPVRANAATLAHMAHAIGLSPERLEIEGQRPDAAEILREIIRTEPAPAPRPRPAPLPPAALPHDGDGSAEGRLAELIAQHGSDRVVAVIASQSRPPEIREREIIAWLRAREEILGDIRGNGTDG